MMWCLTEGTPQDFPNRGLRYPEGRESGHEIITKGVGPVGCKNNLNSI